MSFYYNRLTVLFMNFQYVQSFLHHLKLILQILKFFHQIIIRFLFRCLSWEILHLYDLFFKLIIFKTALLHNRLTFQTLNFFLYLLNLIYQILGLINLLNLPLYLLKSLFHISTVLLQNLHCLICLILSLVILIIPSSCDFGSIIDMLPYLINFIVYIPI